MNSITSDPLLARVLSSLPEHIPIYMVGGAVRDVLIGRAIHDYDFVMPAPVLPEARRLANIIGAAYYAMDVEHDTARLKKRRR